MSDQRQFPTWIVVLLAPLLFVGSFFLVARLTDRDPTPTVPTTQPSPDDPATPPTTTAPPPSDPPTSAPAQWDSTDVAGITLPVSIQAGPHDLTDGLARGFERTELGAVMAAVHLANRANGYATPEVFEPTIQEQVVAGESQQRLLSEAQASYDRLVQEHGRPDPQATAVLRGYRVTTFSPDAATVELWSEANGPDGLIRVAVPVRLSWTGGQWKLIPPGEESSVRELTDTQPFTEFPSEVI